MLKPAARAAPSEERAVFRGAALPWLFLLPTLLILAVFIYLPALRTLRLAAFRANVILGTEQFVGLGNFAGLLASPAYQQVAFQTLVFTVLTVAGGLLCSLSLAWLASRPIRGAKTYRLLLIYPYALSPAIAGTLWLFLFNPEIGVVNQVLRAAFHVQPRWLDTPILAFGLVTLASIWKGLAYNIVFYLASIQNLPGDVMEAAQIDGATPRQVFWRVAFPLLSPITFFLVFTNIISALFDSFALTDILTRGGPYVGHAGITTFLVYQLYQDGFVNFKTGAAAAQAALMLALVAFITVMQFRVGERRVHYGA
ncbi:sn-glycerol 3-phosphate transport system permease protein [Deinococcus metalli]|uniref:Glycerol-3-phosphate transporter permease n=1 Tax=Deinococcus metalli TaxID=1141878 RepID=A0A7W8NT13_9DEIO|nr:sugar ABC transporter permease [Deinococcus metalli]MBB5377722.1 sn-glycerol 3-phosphate transport system permease protein [Deinococcus metalli]GHF52841.1 glycerol-3-phosphate transporter permease [Deinococcus metalli]